MNTATVEMIKDELAAELTGRRFGKVFQLSRTELAVDFRLPDSRYLYINVSPADPRLFLITRRLKDLEKASENPSPFALTLRKRLSGFEVTEARRMAGERIVEILLYGEDETGMGEAFRLTTQLTGRSSNLFLLDREGTVIDRIRPTTGEGQQIGEVYSAPVRTVTAGSEKAPSEADLAATAGSTDGPSETLDAFYSELAAETKFSELARRAAGKIDAEIKKRERLLGRMKDDLAGHGDPEKWKRLGDLLLSNTSTAKRSETTVTVVDYFDNSLPEIPVEVDENDSITEAAEKYYRKYTKARNAAAELSARLEKVAKEIASLRERKTDIERAIAERDVRMLEDLVGEGKAKLPPSKARDRQNEPGSGSRSFISSDGFEILVGKKAKDNDFLTFRVAKSLDTWMHAADYPGSHVVIRNPNRVEIPQRTLLEAARLAAFYSQGKSQTKAAVHYTLKKFVNKPKGTPPGLVSLASFKTLLVEPGVPVERIKDKG